MSHHFLQVNSITKSYNQQSILEEVSFTTDPHKNIAIVGVSGSGKTSLLKIISGHLQATNGEVLFEGEKVLGPLEKLLPGHKSIGYLSQHYEMPNNYVVEDLILFNEKLLAQRIDELLAVCQVTHLLKRKTTELSGGEKQRIALCKILIAKPKLLVLDEPFSNLDLWHTNTLKTVLHNLQYELGITVLLASHNPLDTLSWADNIIVLQEGKIVQNDTPSAIFYHPINAYVANLFGNYTNLQTLVNTPNFSIVRPNQIYLSSNLNSKLIGTISNIQFFGTYYELAININNQICFVHTLAKPMYVVNDVVGLTLNTNSPN